MDGIGDLFVAIVELFVRLLYGVIRIFMRIIGFVLSHTWIVNHFAALRSFGIWLALAMGAYLGFGIVRSAVPALYTPALTPIYQWQTVALAILIMLLGIAMRELDPANFVPDNTHHKFEPDRPVASKQTGPIQSDGVHSTGLIAVAVFVVLVIGIFSAVSSERHEATLAEKICAQAQARVSDGVEQSVREGAGLFDRVFGTQTADRIPCADD